jgi:aryl-alcohol dehydrogenase-like predicted oxidoreductase
MRYRRLGKSGLKVSEIALGSWLTYGGHVEDEAAEACIHAAWEEGITFFDTANVYRRGDAERVVGRALAQYDRDDYVLATKVYFPMGDGPNDKGLGRKHVVEQCERSLDRLGVDYIDLLQAHRFDRGTPLEETVRAFDDLVSSGKVLYIGVSEWEAEQLEAARDIADRLLLRPMISNQPQYSMLWPKIEDAVIPVSERLGIGQVVWSPLAQGVLTGKYLPGEQPPADSRAAGDDATAGFMGWLLEDDILAAVQELRPIAADLGLTLPQLAVAWVLRQPNVASAIVGASRPEQVRENAAASGVELSGDVLRRIHDVIAPVARRETPQP